MSKYIIIEINDKMEVKIIQTDKEVLDNGKSEEDNLQDQSRRDPSVKYCKDCGFFNSRDHICRCSHLQVDSYQKSCKKYIQSYADKMQRCAPCVYYNGDTCDFDDNCPLD